MTLGELPGDRIELPPEPSHDRLIEARTPGGGMLVLWRDHDGLLWRPIAGSRNRRPEDWANIVEGALRLRWELFSCEDGRAT